MNVGGGLPCSFPGWDRTQLLRLTGASLTRGHTSPSGFLSVSFGAESANRTATFKANWLMAEIVCNHFYSK